MAFAKFEDDDGMQLQVFGDDQEEEVQGSMAADVMNPRSRSTGGGGGLDINPIYNDDGRPPSPPSKVYPPPSPPSKVALSL